LVGEVVDVGGHQVVRRHLGEQLEPERRHGGEDPTLVRDLLVHHHVEGRDPVGGDQQQVVGAGVVDAAHLAFGHEGEVDSHRRS
jgi:hypothetical protein